MDFPISEISLPESDLRIRTQRSSPDFSYLAPNSQDNMFLDTGLDSGFADDTDFVAALANFQPCHDCSSTTQTTIPHHHHPSGRLAGASAQLDGHYCCSWLVHGQPCFLCFQSAEALDNHIKNDHAGKDGTYRCLWQDCSKQHTATGTVGPVNFGNKPKLMRHVHSHTGYKPFACPFPSCDKGFVTKEQLKNHETTHTKTRKHKCEQCGKAFAVKSALTTHITAVHDEKKIHTCDICGKAFADSSNLSKHKQTHYRDTAGRKQRRAHRRATSTISTRSSPSTIGPPTPIMHAPNLSSFSAGFATPSNLMAPPAPPYSQMTQALFPTNCCPLPPGTATTSTSSSPPPATEEDSLFDPSCYCCEADCPPPAGPATPCDSPDGCCDLEGFCDLPECLGEPCCPEASTIATCCDDALLPHQIEQLRDFQAPPVPMVPWEDLFNGGSSGMGMDAHYFPVHGS